MSALQAAGSAALPACATDAERRHVADAAEQIERLAEALQPATENEIINAFEQIVAALPSAPAASDESAELRATGYLIGLEGASAKHLRRAVAAFLRGEAGNGFRPSPPELRRAVDSYARSEANLLARHRSELTAIRERVEGRLDWPDDAAVAERRREHAARVLAKAGFRARPIDTGDEASPERRAEAQAKLDQWKREAAAEREQQQEEVACAE